MTGASRIGTVTTRWARTIASPLCINTWPLRTSATFVAVRTVIPDSCNRWRTTSLAGAPNMPSGSCSGVMRVSATSRHWLYARSAVMSASS